MSNSQSLHSCRNTMERLLTLLIVYTQKLRHSVSDARKMLRYLVQVFKSCFQLTSVEIPLEALITVWLICAGIYFFQENIYSWYLLVSLHLLHSIRVHDRSKWKTIKLRSPGSLLARDSQYSVSIKCNRPFRDFFRRLEQLGNFLRWGEPFWRVKKASLGHLMSL